MDLHHHRLLLYTESGSPPGTENVRGGSLTGAEKLDANTVIILASLLCAVICVLVANSIIRCLQRCSRRFASEEPATTGLRKSELRRIPVAVYGSGENIPATDCCPICLGEFVGGEKVRVLPKCGHGFHVRCVDVWLAAHSSCPTCRRSLIERAAEATVDGPADLAGGSGNSDGTGTAEEVG